MLKTFPFRYSRLFIGGVGFVRIYFSLFTIPALRVNASLSPISGLSVFCLLPLFTGRPAYRALMLYTKKIISSFENLFNCVKHHSISLFKLCKTFAPSFLANRKNFFLHSGEQKRWSFLFGVNSFLQFTPWHRVGHQKRAFFVRDVVMSWLTIIASHS